LGASDCGYAVIRVGLCASPKMDQFTSMPEIGHRSYYRTRETF